MLYANHTHIQHQQSAGTAIGIKPAEMKLLLSREYVKAWRGMKDRRILSPSRINLAYHTHIQHQQSAGTAIGINLHAISATELIQIPHCFLDIQVSIRELARV